MKPILIILSFFFIQSVFAQIQLAGNYQLSDSIKTHVEFLSKPRERFLKNYKTEIDNLRGRNK